MEAKDLYFPESELESAFDWLLSSQELTVYTPLKSPEFQKKKPRIELDVVSGSAISMLIPDNSVGMVAAPGVLREGSWKGALNIRVVAADIMSNRDHLARVRAALAVCVDKINANLSDNECHYYLQEIASSGSSQHYKPDETTYITEISYAIKYSLLSDFVAQIEEEPTNETE